MQLVGGLYELCRSKETVIRNWLFIVTLIAVV